MLRVVLIAYLSLTTVLGPALCCCNAQQLISVVDGSKCCGVPGARRSDAQLANDDGHSHHPGHAHHRHEHSPARDVAKTEPSPVRHEHNKENCPCGKHHASMVAAVTDSVKVKAVELQNQTWFVLVSLLPVLPEFDAEKASMIAHRRPADLCGREILRAYRIMRC